MVTGDCPLSPGSRVVAYFRDSGGTGQERSVGQQRRVADAYCELHHLVLLRVFADEARVGSTVVGRDQFEEMISWLRQLAPEDKRKKRSPAPEGRPDGVLLWDLKRFARNQLDGQYFKADLRRRGYTIVFLSDDIPAGDLAPVYESMLEWKAQQDLIDISKDVRRGLEDLVGTRGPDGKYLGLCPGRPPTAFKGEPYLLDTPRRDGRPHVVQRWVVDDEVWPVALRAFELRDEGRSYAEVHATLHLFKSINCYPTFFSNRIYTGTLVYGGKTYENFVPPLVSQEVWERVQARVTPKRERRPRQATSDYTLAGLLFCGVCGGAMAGNAIAARADAGDGHPRARYRRYTCTRWKRGHDCTIHHVSAQLVEQAVYRKLAEEVLQPERLLQMLADTKLGQEERSDLETLIGRLEGEIADLDKAIKRLVDALEKAGYSETVGERLAQREQERAARDGELQDARRRLAQGEIKVPRPLLEAFCAGTQAVLSGGDPEDIRALLRKILIRVDLYNDHSGTVYYTFPQVEWIR